MGVQEKYDVLLKDYVNLEVRCDLLEQRLARCEERCRKCEESVKQLQEMVQNQQKEIMTIRAQVNDLMGLGKRKK